MSGAGLIPIIRESVLIKQLAGVLACLPHKSLERPDDITALAVSAREQISKAIADKIRDLRTAEDVKTVQDVLPEIEKFLESPEQRRLRQISSKRKWM